MLCYLFFFVSLFFWVAVTYKRSPLGLGGFTASNIQVIEYSTTNFNWAGKGPKRAFKDTLMQDCMFGESANQNTTDLAFLMMDVEFI